VSAIAALVGAVVGGMFTLEVGNRSAEAAAATQERDLRRVAYTEFLDALDAYSTAAALRVETCVRGSNEPRAFADRCEVWLDEYQSTRYAFVKESNEMQLIASREALDLVDMIAGVLPQAQVGLTGEPVDQEIDTAAYDAFYLEFLGIAACDTSPNPHVADCSDTRAEVGLLDDLRPSEVPQ
jgi:hypothetical protein